MRTKFDWQPEYGLATCTLTTKKGKKIEGNAFEREDASDKDSVCNTKEGNKMEKRKWILILVIEALIFIGIFGWMKSCDNQTIDKYKQNYINYCVHIFPFLYKHIDNSYYYHISKHYE